MTAKSRFNLHIYTVALLISSYSLTNLTHTLNTIMHTHVSLPAPPHTHISLKFKTQYSTHTYIFSSSTLPLVNHWLTHILTQNDYQTHSCIAPSISTFFSLTYLIHTQYSTYTYVSSLSLSLYHDSHTNSKRQTLKNTATAPPSKTKRKKSSLSNLRMPRGISFEDYDSCLMDSPSIATSKPSREAPKTPKSPRKSSFPPLLSPSSPPSLSL